MTDLTTHFNDVVQQLRTSLPGFAADALGSVGITDITLPVLNLAAWARRRDSNCYSFAADCPGTTMPGSGIGERLSNACGHFDINLRRLYQASEGGAQTFLQFAKLVQEGLRRDGFKAAGYAPPVVGTRHLVALFAGEASERYSESHDFHFYALRQSDAADSGARLVWAHKRGQMNAVVCDGGPDVIFDDAQGRDYNYFAGFWMK